MKRSIKLFLSVLICQQLAGCSYFFGDEGYFRDRSGDYLKATTIPPIDIPEEMTQTSLEPLFDIPKIEEENGLLNAQFDVPRPNKVAINAEDENVRIQKLGSRQWIVIDKLPEQVWPRIIQFLSENEVDISNKSPNEGLIETDWLGYEDDTVTKNKYRIRIEQGLRRGSAEVHVIHLMVPRSVKGGGQLTWPDRSVNTERETWLVEELAGSLVDDSDSSGISLMAQAIMAEPKAKLVGNENNEPRIELNLDYSRAWASVGFALGKDGFELLDDDRESGVYYIAFNEEPEEEVEDEEPGFFSRLFSSKKSTDEETPEQRRERSDYKVLVQQSDKAVVVKISYLKEEELEKDQLLNVMSRIRNNLS